MSLRTLAIVAALAIPVTAAAQTMGSYNHPSPPPTGPEYLKPHPSCGINDLGFWNPGFFFDIPQWNDAQQRYVYKPYFTGRCWQP